MHKETARAKNRPEQCHSARGQSDRKNDQPRSHDLFLGREQVLGTRLINDHLKKNRTVINISYCWMSFTEMIANQEEIALHPPFLLQTCRIPYRNTYSIVHDKKQQIMTCLIFSCKNKTYGRFLVYCFLLKEYRLPALETSAFPLYCTWAPKAY